MTPQCYSQGPLRARVEFRGPSARRHMFSSIVVGTDGSSTAQEAVRQAAQLAKSVNAKVYIVSAFEPVSDARLRDEQQQVPEDLQWMVNPREDVEDALEAGAQPLHDDGLVVETIA